jgi:hypothetical protein
MVKATTKAVKTKTAATKRGKAPQTSKPGRGRGREVDPSVRVRWRAEEDALVERLRGEGQTWPQIAEAVSRLHTARAALKSSRCLSAGVRSTSGRAASATCGSRFARAS